MSPVQNRPSDPFASLLFIERRLSSKGPVGAGKTFGQFARGDFPVGVVSRYLVPGDPPVVDRLRSSAATRIAASHGIEEVRGLGVAPGPEENHRPPHFQVAQEPVRGKEPEGAVELAPLGVEEQDSGWRGYLVFANQLLPGRDVHLKRDEMLVDILGDLSRRKRNGVQPLAGLSLRVQEVDENRFPSSFRLFEDLRLVSEPADLRYWIGGLPADSSGILHASPSRVGDVGASSQSSLQ